MQTTALDVPTRLMKNIRLGDKHTANCLSYITRLVDGANAAPSNPTLYLTHRPLQTLPLGGDTSRYTVPCKRHTKHHVTKGTLYHGVKQGSSVVTCSYARYTQRWIVCNGYTALVMVVVPGCLANSLLKIVQFVASPVCRKSCFL